MELCLETKQNKKNDGHCVGVRGYQNKNYKKTDQIE